MRGFGILTQRVMSNNLANLESQSENPVLPYMASGTGLLGPTLKVR